VGPYLTVPTAAGAALGTHARGQWRAGARRGLTAVRVGPKGTAVHPLDGGALSRVGNALTGERARGGATVSSSKSL
jgi:hypothetical protein